MIFNTIFESESSYAAKTTIRTPEYVKYSLPEIKNILVKGGTVKSINKKGKMNGAAVTIIVNQVYNERGKFLGNISNDKYIQFLKFIENDPEYKADIDEYD
jgi:hypothetical protein